MRRDRDDADRTNLVTTVSGHRPNGVNSLVLVRALDDWRRPDADLAARVEPTARVARSHTAPSTGQSPTSPGAHAATSQARELE